MIWPATCAVTSTPRDARSEPTAGITGVHDSEVTVVVETVTDFVSDDRADTSVIGRVIRLDIEKRRLQDGGREDNLIPLRVVISVDSLRGQEPFRLVNRSIQLVEVATVFKRK